MKLRKAFTLIELLIVIAIIGILATLIFVNVNLARKKARDAKRLADLKNLQTAVEMYNQDSSTGAFPITTGSTATSATWWGNCSSTGITQKSTWIVGLAPTYISSLPSDPLSTNRCYSYASNGTDYKIVATLENDLKTTDAFYRSNQGTKRAVIENSNWLGW